MNDEIKIIDYKDMFCHNCGNKPRLGCLDISFPSELRALQPCAEVCDLWVPIDYFNYYDHYPEFEIINEPEEED